SDRTGSPAALLPSHQYGALMNSQRIIAALAMLLCLAACNEESTEPEEDSLVFPALTTPENVISAIEVIYNDKEHGADERLTGYASLLAEPFIFNFQPSDIINGLPPSWGKDAELAAHQAMFQAQSDGNIYSIELRIVHNPAQDLTPPDPNRVGWKHVFATNVYLRL